MKKKEAKTNRMNRNNYIGNLPAELRDAIVRLLHGRDPQTGIHLPIREVLQRVKPIFADYNSRHKTKFKLPGVATISNYWGKYESARVEEESKRARRVDEFIAKFQKAIGAADGSEAITKMLDVTIFENRKDLDAVNVGALINLRARMQQMELKKQELELRRDLLQKENERLKAQTERWKAMATKEQGVELPPDEKIYNFVAIKILKALASYKDLTPLLKNYRRNIAKRLANDARDFDLSDVVNG